MLISLAKVYDKKGYYRIIRNVDNTENYKGDNKHGTYLGSDRRLQSTLW